MVWHRCSHPIRVHLSVIWLHPGHVSTLESLLLCHGAVLVCQQQCLQIDNLFSERSNLLCQLVVLRLVEINLVLKVCEPLLLALTTF